ncbi:hypothetical protein BDV25DRAFT_2883 [Aspergillus avenaceus]|uniref:Integral membrane protein n=1 Tax=Aspergillus avenaceus TaxID=36643 RepID=A0A5N6TSQ1_ASPAV|nr:hypothetical protein BDV25DRAFT_2883 [Aspergillus avenaceus]
MRFSALPNPRAFIKAPTYTRRVFLTFLLIYLFLFLCARYKSHRDPTSAFFQPKKGYLTAYSDIRFNQAQDFIEQVNNQTNSHAAWRSSDRPNLCVGVATVARKGARYFKSAVGSILEGLSEAERADLHLILFVAHTDPTQHPAYREPWLREVADEVLLYDPSTVNITRIHELESDEHKLYAREKALFDYTYLLKACHAVNAPYIVMLEDDVLAIDGWYHRTQSAIADTERQMKAKTESKWLYLRLFYTEQFLGWNSEEWPSYLFFSLLIDIVLLSALLTLKSRYPHHLPPDTIFLATALCTPLLIGLFFAAGRVTMLPIPAGVHEMPKFGCCSQAFVFPRSRIPDLIQLYESKKVGYVDMLTEEYADAHGEIRWALTPSIVQHMGRKSSKNFDMNQPKLSGGVTELWNFAFETNEPDLLRVEHEGILHS